MSHRVVAITGANRGLGLALAKRIACSNNFYSKVILCSRDEKKGKEAINSILKEGNVRAELEAAILDMDSKESISRFTQDIKKKYGQIFALVNNAGILIKDPVVKPEVLEKTASTNLFGVISLSDQFLEQDLLQRRGKLIGVSSKLASSSFIRDAELKNLLSNITRVESLQPVYQYMLEQVKANKASSLFVPKFPFAEYSVLKRMMSIYYRILAESATVQERGLFVATLCPGWCKTDMGGQMATNSVESGTDLSYQLLTEDSGASHPLQGKLIYASNAGVTV